MPSARWPCLSPPNLDLIITDLSLPKMNGTDLARELRAMVATPNPSSSSPPYAESIARDKERLANVNLLMGKPFSIEQLQRCPHLHFFRRMNPKPLTVIAIFKAKPGKQNPPLARTNCSR